MQIAIDARELVGRPTGVGRYLFALLRQWALMPAAARHRFTLYAPSSATPSGALPGMAGGDRLNAGVTTIPGAPGTLWEQVRLAAAIGRDRPDVLFAPAYTSPLATKIPVALTVHDISFIAHPEWFRPRERWRRSILTRLAARRAELVLTVSEFSRRELTDRLRIEPGRTRVIPSGVEHAGTVAAQLSDAGRDSSRSGRDPIVLFAGSIFNRRRVPDLIRAFGEVAGRHADARLEIVGDDRTYPRQDLHAAAAATGFAQRIGIRAYVSDEQLASLYASARAFAFLSEYEGFGLTPLEALAAGIPVVLLDTPVAREVCGDAALYVAPGDIEGTAAALTSALYDAAARRALLDRAAVVLARYSWERAAAETLAALEEAAGRVG